MIKCPKCDKGMGKMVRRLLGVRIETEICHQCRGEFFDSGEAEQLVELENRIAEMVQAQRKKAQDKMNVYGQELILDLHHCSRLPCDRQFLVDFLAGLCARIGMKREDLHFWDYEGEPEEYAAAPPHLKGISAVQFIATSTIVIHTLDVPRSVYLNVFSCKSFEASAAEGFCSSYFEGVVARRQAIERTAP